MQGRSVGGQNFEAAGKGSDDPEHRLLMAAAPDQLAAAVDRGRARRGGDVAAEEERRTGMRSGRVESPGQRVQMGFRLLRPELSAAEQPQQLGVSGAEPVVGQRLPGGEITQPYGRIAQRGRKQDMGHDPGRKQPRGHLVVPWCGRVDAAKSTLYAFPGVFAAAAYPWPFGDTGATSVCSLRNRPAGSAMIVSVRKLAAR